jgi:hypothetical protein
MRVIWMTWRNPHATVRYDVTRKILYGVEPGPMRIDRITAWRMFLDQRANHIAAGIPYTVSQEITHEPAEGLDAAAIERASASADAAALRPA